MFGIYILVVLMKCNGSCVFGILRCGDQLQLQLQLQMQLQLSVGLWRGGDPAPISLPLGRSQCAHSLPNAHTPYPLLSSRLAFGAFFASLLLALSTLRFASLGLMQQHGNRSGRQGRPDRPRPDDLRLLERSSHEPRLGSRGLVGQGCQLLEDSLLRL